MLWGKAEAMPARGRLGVGGPDQGRGSVVDERLCCVRLGSGNGSERWGLSSGGQRAGVGSKWQHCVFSALKEVV